MATKLKRKPVSSLESAIEMYYLNLELTTANIKKCLTYHLLLLKSTKMWLEK